MEGMAGGGGREGTQHGMRNSRWLRLDVFIRTRALVWPRDIYLSRKNERASERASERDAPPKNQIKCKNRINSSWRTRELSSSAPLLFVELSATLTGCASLLSLSHPSLVRE
jgi:hypothetical protein